MPTRTLLKGGQGKLKHAPPILVALLLAAPAGALDNSVRVHNQYAGVLLNHPIWFGRWFAQGEIPRFCRPYTTPSDTGLRIAVTEWQCDVKNRWRDATSNRAITNVRTGSPSWTNGAGLANIAMNNDVATMTTTVPHGLAVGDRLAITGSPTATALVKDNFVVHEVPSPTTARFIVRSVGNGTYMTNFAVSQAIDPMAPNALRFYSADHGFYKGETVTITGVGGVAGANGTFTITGVSRHEFVVNATAAGTYTGGGTAAGPDNGSVRFAFVALKATIPNGGSTRIDFEDDGNPSSAGNAEATLAAGLDKDEMLAATWNAQLDAIANVKTGSTGTLSTNARAMLISWNGTQSYCGPRYWTAGPVITWFILEYGCSGALNNDFGWKIGAGNTTTVAIPTTAQTQFTVASLTDIEVGTRLWFNISVGSSAPRAEIMTVTGIDSGTNTLTVVRGSDGTATSTYPAAKGFGIFQWQDAPDANYKSVHPAFQLRFVNGWNGVGIRFEVENEWWNKHQSVWYAANLRTGEDLTARIAIPEFKHANLTSWRATVWDGADPEFYCAGGGADPDNCSGTGGGVRTRKYRINHNTPYLIYARALPQWQLYTGVSTNSATLPWLTTGFSLSDKGRTGVARTSVYGGSVWPGKYLGWGTWGTDNATLKTARTDFQNGTQEGSILDIIQAAWIQSWDLAGYEINFGDSVPGGGGNIQAGGSIVWHRKEDDAGLPRVFFPGWSDPAFSRPLSLYARPTFRTNDYTVSVALIDRPRTACTGAAAPALITTANANWPCYHASLLQGGDGWNLEAAHMNDWNWLGYLITADPSMLADTLHQASYTTGLNGSHRNIGKSWMLNEENGLIRSESLSTRQAMRAFLLYPNMPQFGATYVLPESHYWNEKIWDLAYFKEGGLDVRDGYFQQHYPLWFTPDCSGYSASLPDIWRFARCHEYAKKPNPLGVPMFMVSASCGVYIDCTITGGTYPIWMFTYSTNQWAWWEELDAGKHFYHATRRTARFQLNMAGNRNANPYLTSSTYSSPVFQADAAKSYFATAADLNNAYAASWPYGSGGITRSRTDPTFDYVSGNSSLLPIGYVPQWIGGIAFLAGLNLSTTSEPGCTPADRPPAGCTARGAYEWFRSATPSQQAWAASPKYNFIPRQRITNLSVTPGGTSAIVTYTAPTADACTYIVSTLAPLNTLDSADSSDGGGVLFRRLVLTGLTPSTTYSLRLTCGSRLPGIATGTTRTVTSFTTLQEGGPVILNLAFGSIPNAATVTVEHGETSSLGSSLSPVSCASGCTVSVPASSGKVVYYRATFQNGSGVTVAQGRAVAAIP